MVLRAEARSSLGLRSRFITGAPRQITRLMRQLCPELFAQLLSARLKRVAAGWQRVAHRGRRKSRPGHRRRLPWQRHHQLKPGEEVGTTKTRKTRRRNALPTPCSARGRQRVSDQLLLSCVFVVSDPIDTALAETLQLLPLMPEPTREQLLAQIAALEKQLAAVQSGSGAIAQGQGNVAAGARGIAIGGDFHGNIYQGAPPKNDAEAIAIYRRMLALSSRQLPVARRPSARAIPPVAEKQIDLDQVYVGWTRTTQSGVEEGKGRAIVWTLPDPRQGVPSGTRPLTALEKPWCRTAASFSSAIPAPANPRSSITSAFAWRCTAWSLPTIGAIAWPIGPRTRPASCR